MILLNKSVFRLSSLVFKLYSLKQIKEMKINMSKKFQVRDSSGNIAMGVEIHAYYGVYTSATYSDMAGIATFEHDIPISAIIRAPVGYRVSRIGGFLW